MIGLFYGCSSIVNLDLSHFDTGNVTDMEGMFYDCSSLKELKIADLNTRKVKNFSNIFEGCNNLNPQIKRAFFQKGDIEEDEIEGKK